VGTIQQDPVLWPIQAIIKFRYVINRNNNKDEKLVQLLYKLEDKDVFSELDFVITPKKKNSDVAQK
jgi:hypothetical protein